MPAKDMYANLASAKVALAANDVTGVEINLGVSLGQKKGILIDRIDYYVRDAFYTLNAGDAVKVGWGVKGPSNYTDLEINDRSIIHFVGATAKNVGTPANQYPIFEPNPFEFTPPIILASPSIYLLAYTGSGSGADTYNVLSRISYRYIDLKTEEYLELAETFLLVG